MRYDGDRYLSVVRDLAKRASQTVLELLKNPIAKARKEDRSWVTEADLQSDRILREGLAKAFPDHAILSEEDGLSGKEGSDWVWLIDPLDGTKAYAKGIAGFAVMVGLLKEGIPCLGVVVDPLQDLIYEAVRGEGATLTSQGKRTRLKVSLRDDFSKMPLITSTGFKEEILRRIVDRLRTPVCDPINSVGIKVGMVVRQEADIYLNHHSVHYWDTCAPQVILEEAGGRFTRLDGKRLEYRMDGPFEHGSLTLATNGTRHEELVGILAEFFG
jgi:3'(2'), 5'-bisphosphate nucleotidase